MGNAEKLGKDLLEAMSGGVDQMTAGGDSVPAPKESGVIISERPDEDDNRMLTKSLMPRAIGDIRSTMVSLAMLAGLTEGDHHEE